MKYFKNKYKYTLKSSGKEFAQHRFLAIFGTTDSASFYISLYKTNRYYKTAYAWCINFFRLNWRGSFVVKRKKPL